MHRFLYYILEAEETRLLVFVVFSEHLVAIIVKLTTVIYTKISCYLIILQQVTDVFEIFFVPQSLRFSGIIININNTFLEWTP